MSFKEYVRDDTLSSNFFPNINTLTSFLQGHTNITKLSLEGCYIDTLDAQALANSPGLKNLTSLVLPDNNIGDEGARDIANSPNLKNLKNLDLSNNNIGDKGARDIANSPSLKNLTSLVLSNNNIGDKGARDIANSPSLKNLTSLVLSNTGIGDEGAWCIANSSNLKNLESLSLCFNRIGNIGTQHIVDSLNLKNLKSLDLYFNEIDDKNVKAALSKLPLKLDLSFNYISDEDELSEIDGLLKFLLKKTRTTLRRIYSNRFCSNDYIGDDLSTNISFLSYHDGLTWDSLADMSGPDKRIILFASRQTRVSSMLEKISSYKESKICIASINSNTHSVVVYLSPKQKKILLIDPYGHGTIPLEIEPLKSKGYTLYASCTPIQKDYYSCRILSLEIARMLCSRYEEIEKYLSARNSNDEPINLYDFLPKEELDQLCKSFSEKINIDCDQVTRVQGADYRTAHFVYSLIPKLEQEKMISFSNFNTPINYESTAEKGHQRRKQMVEKIRSFFIDKPDNVKLFHRIMNELLKQENQGRKVNEELLHQIVNKLPPKASFVSTQNGRTKINNASDTITEDSKKRPTTVSSSAGSTPTAEDKEPSRPLKQVVQEMKSLNKSEQKDEVKHTESKVANPASVNNNISTAKAPGNNGTTFWSSKIALGATVVSCVAGATAAYVLAYPMVALALTVLAAVILMGTGIAKVLENPSVEKPVTSQQKFA